MNHLGRSATSKQFLTTATVVLVLTFLAGCSGWNEAASSVDPVKTEPSVGAGIHGSLYGGQQPVAGAKVYLYAAGVTGYGNGAQSLLSSSVLTNSPGASGSDSSGNYYVSTDTSGGFQITGDYTCPAATTIGGNTYLREVYLVATGGNAGGGVNSNIAMIAPLGGCPAGATLSASLFVNINEVTTAAAVVALQQFMSSPTGVAGSFSIGTSNSNLAGLQNAFATFTSLVDITTGAPITSTTISPESAKLLTLGNILAYCVNSVASGNACSNLYTSVTPASTSTLSTSGATAGSLSSPADTVQAAWYLAQFPSNINGSASCGTAGGAFLCASSTPPFGGGLSSTPNDWTVAVGYAPQSGGGNAIGTPFWVALDPYGNAWVTNTSTSSPGSSVTELSPTGSVIMAPVTSYTAAANSGYAATLASSGVSQAAAARTIKTPHHVVIDSVGNAWVADTSDTPITISGTSYTCASGNTCYFSSVAEFPASAGIGVGSSGAVSGYYSGYSPYAAAADASGNVFFTLTGGSTNPGSKVVAKFNASGAYTSGVGIGTSPYGIAVDHDTTITNGPLVWVPNQRSNSPCSDINQEYTVTGAQSSGNKISTSASCTPETHTFTALTGVMNGIAADASNNMWIANAAIQTGTTTAGSAANSVTYLVVTQSTGVPGTTSTGSITSTIPSSGSGVAGLNNPQYLAIDGAGNAWVSNQGAASVSELNVTNAGTATMAINSLSGTNGFVHSVTGSAINSPEGISIDLSGNVWVANNASGANYLTVLVGAAVPVAPPIPGKLGVRP